MTRTLCIAGGNGCTGKTDLAVRLAGQLAGQGHRTCVFVSGLDAPLLAPYLSGDPERSLKDVLQGRAEVADILIQGPEGAHIVPRTNDLERAILLDEAQTAQLPGRLAGLDDYDFMLFDPAPGLSRHTTAFCLASSSLVLALTPEASVLEAARDFLGLLAAKGLQAPVLAAMSQCEDMDEARTVCEAFVERLRKELRVELLPPGFLPRDPSAEANEALVRHLLDCQPDGGSHVPDLLNFWTTCLQYAKTPPTAAASGSTKTRRTDGPRRPNGRGRAPQAGASAPAAFTLDPGIGSLFSEMVENLASVTRELKSIREAIQEAGLNGGAHSRVRPIVLDYEGFLSGGEPASEGRDESAHEQED